MSDAKADLIPAPPSAPLDTERYAHAAYAKAVVRARSTVSRFLPGDLFSDPAYDILMCMYASEGEQIPVSIKTACDATRLPRTTGLRWVGRLEDRGLVRRSADPHDGRRIFLHLTDRAREGVRSYLSAIVRFPLKDVDGERG